MVRLFLTLALLAAPLGARAASVPPLGGELAAVPPQRLAERLAEAHAATDAALGQRKAEVARYRGLVKERDQAALAVDAEKRAIAAGTGSRERLTRLLAVAHASDERVQAAHAAVRAADREVARQGGTLLKLYDALLVEKRRELERLSQSDSRRAPIVAAYQRFAETRDGVREALRPALTEVPTVAAGALSLEVRPGDDVETMLEKVDLARDLEARLLSQADALRRRIVELESEQSLARDVTGLSRTGALFDEADRRLRAPASAVLGTGPVRVTLPSFGFPTAAMEAGGDSRQSAGDAPPADNGNVVVTPSDPTTEPNTPPPPSDEGSEVPGVDLDDGDFGASPEPNVGGSRDVPVSAVGSGGTGGTSDARNATEQVFIGGRDGKTSIDTLVAVEGMSLDELRALEKKLRADAARVNAQGKALKKSVDGSLAPERRR